MKILVVLGCLALGSTALSGGHGDVFSKSNEITVPAPQGHGDVFSKPREITAPSPKGHGDVFSKPRGVTVSGGHGDVFAPVAN